MKKEEINIYKERYLDKAAKAPVEEPERQYYFMELLKDIIANEEQIKGSKLTYHVETFGCQMNAKDSEKLAGILETIGYVNQEDEKADFVIYNTCTVRENANQRVFGRIGFLGTLKKKNPKKKIAVCGCMMQEEKAIQKMQEVYSFVDIIFGTHNIYTFAELLFNSFMQKGQLVSIWNSTDRIVENLPSSHKYSFKAGVNIMFGCNNFCSYCIVPYVRGRERSRKIEDIVAEIKQLVSEGIVEVMLLGQNVNSYGKNLETPVSFAKLLDEVCKIDGLKRVRFMTSHPKDLSDELIEAMKNNEKVCRHLHLPMQSGSSKILNEMNRRYTKEQYLELVQKIKTAIPDISLTTDIIVGFPTETEEDFLETIDVVKKVKFDSCYTFIYSKRNNTKAALLEPVFTEDEVKDRFNRLLKAIDESNTDNMASKVGKTYEVLVEEENTQDPSLVTGRLSNNLLVHFPGCKELLGTLVNVELTECKGFYYLGRIV